MKVIFSTDNINRVFSKDGNNPESFMNAFFDYVTDEDIVVDGKKITAKQMNDKISSVMFDILGIDHYNPNERGAKKRLKRAWNAHSAEVYEVLEEPINFKVTTGFRNNEFFNTFVQYKNLGDGEQNEFYVDKDVVLEVAEVSGDNHDLTLQRLGEGRSFRVPTSDYAVKIGMDIDLYLTGKKDWYKLIDSIAEAFMIKIQNTIYTEFADAGLKLPNSEQFNITDDLTIANKEKFDNLLSNVSMANDGVDVIIMGLKNDLKKLNALANIDWLSEDQKKENAKLGRLGSYEGTALMEIPNRFVKNNVTKKLITPGKLHILPNVDNEFVKVIDVGDIEILEKSEKGDRNDDFMTYEVQREMGVATIFDKYHGVWEIA